MHAKPGRTLTRDHETRSIIDAMIRQLITRCLLVGTFLSLGTLGCGTSVEVESLLFACQSDDDCPGKACHPTYGVCFDEATDLSVFESDVGHASDVPVNTDSSEPDGGPGDALTVDAAGDATPLDTGDSELPVPPEDIVTLLDTVDPTDAPVNEDTLDPPPDVSVVQPGLDPVDCEEYCQGVTTFCTGLNANYDSEASCLTFCTEEATFVKGTPGETDANSLSCRTQHATLAEAGKKAAAKYCLAAGPSGGGVCGSFCTVYCDAALKVCDGEEGFKMGADACEVACLMVSSDGLPGGKENTIQCRLDHIFDAAALDGESKSASCDQGHPSESKGCPQGSTVQPTCSAYCADVIGVCGHTLGAGAKPAGQYLDDKACLAACETSYKFPAGQVWNRSQNTLGCRVWHAKAALSEDPLFHCEAAGPTGGGVCGDPCELYCELTAATCAEDLAPYESPAACLTACAEMDTSGKVGATQGDSLQCRLGLLAASWEDSFLPATQCPLVGADPKDGCVGDVNKPTCPTYCTLLEDSCPGFFENLSGTCELACEGLEIAPGGFQDDQVNTVGCRMYHAAQNLYGVGTCDPAHLSGGGVCGAYCDNYCSWEMTICKDFNPFASADLCDLACASYPVTENLFAYTEDSVQCRINHFVGAITKPAVHCPHTSPAGGGACTDD